MDEKELDEEVESDGDELVVRVGELNRELLLLVVVICCLLLLLDLTFSALV